MNKVVSQVWAKSGEKGTGNPIRLAEHTWDVLAVFDKIKPRVNSHLCDLIRLAIVCHDWGKVLPAFQIRTLKNSSYAPHSPLIQMPHSFFSLLWIDEKKLQEKLQKELPGKDSRDYQEFVLSAIAYHHWRESFFDLISTSHEEMANLFEELLERPERIDQLQTNLGEEIRQLPSDWHELIGFHKEMAEGLRNKVPFSEYARPPYQLYFLPKRIGIDEQKMKDWILIAGFLQRSDHFASFCEEEGDNACQAEAEIDPLDSNTVQNKVRAKIQEKNPTSDASSIWQLTKINCRDKNLVLIAPTGYGKTEFAFLWGSGEKFFYTLPLRAAVNQIYKRAAEVFGEDKTGLLHSDADVFLLGDGGEGQATLKAYDLARQLAFPAIICTGDQFFPYALRPPGYEKIYATFSYARLIVDEVQAYDPRAAAIVVQFIEHIVRMGGKFLLMTATLPEFVRKELQKALESDTFEEINLYEEQESDFKAIKKHKIRVELIENNTSEEIFSIPDENLVAILETASQGKRVLVIANTVKQAQDIFSRLKEKIKSNSTYAALQDKLWLLHSRFTLKDRDMREQTLKTEFSNPKPYSESEGKILVATQVVEASLDIDVDVLFTEIPPLDALVQRMGRVLRRYGPMNPPRSKPEEPNVFVWVFKNGLQSGRGYVYDEELVLSTLRLLVDSENKAENEKWKRWIEQKKGKSGGDTSNQEASGGRGRKKQKKGGQSQGVSPDSSNSFEPMERLISEYDKYDLVKKLYESLPKDGSYLMKFQQTKDILDAGYMSDKKEEAQKLFRTIHTIPIIPSNMKNDLKDDICDFSEQVGARYTQFKRDILAKYAVQVFLSGAYKHKLYENSVESWMKDLECLKEKQRRRIGRWCRDIYFVEAEYDRDLGVKGIEEYNEEEEGIIIS